MSILAFLLNYSSNVGAGIFESANNLLQFLPAAFPALSFILKGLRTQEKVKFRWFGYPPPTPALKVTTSWPLWLHNNDTNT